MALGRFSTPSIKVSKVYFMHTKVKNEVTNVKMIKKGRPRIKIKKRFNAISIFSANTFKYTYNSKDKYMRIFTSKTYHEIIF